MLGMDSRYGRHSKRLYAQTTQSIAQIRYASLWVNIPGGAPAPPECPSEPLQHFLSPNVIGPTVRAVVIVAVEFDRKTTIPSTFDDEIEEISRHRGPGDANESPYQGRGDQNHVQNRIGTKSSTFDGGRMFPPSIGLRKCSIRESFKSPGLRWLAATERTSTSRSRARDAATLYRCSILRAVCAKAVFGHATIDRNMTSRSWP